MKDKKGINIINAFKKFLKQSAKKPNKIWVDKGSEICNTHFKIWLKDNNIEMYSTHNEGKSVVAERFIRTFKNKIYKYMTSISKNVSIGKLDDIVNEYNNTYHRTIKMKPIDVKDNTYIDFDNDPKFKVGDHVRISKYKNIFAKGYTPNCSEEIFVIKEIKNIVLWTHVINDLNGEETIGTFYENEWQRTNQQEFRIEKVIKRKGDKLYVKWKGYDNSFHSWVDEKDLSQYFAKPYEPFRGDINVKVGLSNYATKTDLKNVSHVDVSSFALKSNLTSLKTEVDKLDIDKLTPAPDDLVKLSNVVNNNVVKKTENNKFVTKVDNIDTTNFVKFVIPEKKPLMLVVWFKNRFQS